MTVTTSGIGYDRSTVREGTSVLLLHAGVADRRMWDPQWDALASTTDLTRLDLRGFGESTTASQGSISHPGDVLHAMDEAGLDRVHVVGCSFGSGVAVEVALTAPDRVASLVLCPPGGSLLASLTEDLRAFFDQEKAALATGDVDAAVEANIRAWVIGSGRTEADIDPDVVEHVRVMQRRAFEIAEHMGQHEEAELDPPALQRLGEVIVPTLIVIGRHDLDTTKDAAERVCAAIPQAQQIEWPDTAHLPSMEQPARFADLLQDWLIQWPMLLGSHRS